MMTQFELILVMLIGIYIMDNTKRNSTKTAVMVMLIIMIMLGIAESLLKYLVNNGVEQTRCLI